MYIHLAWESVNENVESGPCESWRVLVVAIHKIMPFKPLIRAAASEEQFALHQSLDYARRGFTLPVLCVLLCNQDYLCCL